MQPPIDLLYILGTGSKWNNNELRLSLRSVQKHMSGVRNIFVVGEDPGFLSSEVKFLPFPDQLPSNKNADGNMAFKIIHACENEALSDDFLFMNDDFIINKLIEASQVPLLYKGDMKERNSEFWNAQFYRHRLYRTYQILKQKGLPTLQYDYHAPMIINKDLFIEVMNQYDFKSDIGYTFRSLYGNTLKLPAQLLTNQKVTIYRLYSLATIKTLLHEASFIGFNDGGLSDAFKYLLFKTFTEKSNFEKDNNIHDRLFDLVLWENEGKSYEKGVSIYKKYFPKTNFSFLLSKYYTKDLEIKLNYRLNQMINNL